MNRWARVGLVAWLVGAAAGVGAQDTPTQLTGRMDSSYTWVAEPSPGGQTLGVVSGWAGLTGGTRDVKSEVRVGYTSLPLPALSLQRAWVKFRFPGVRFTTGLGRLAWGPGFVLVPGDLLFDSLGTNPDFNADELRTQGAWLGAAWLALGDEAFAEAAVLKDAAGLRVSAAPLGVTLEAAGAWDRRTETGKAALSTQFHAGLDWYATVRQDFSHARLSLDQTSTGAGAFGLWNLTDGFSLSTRHEALAPATKPGRLKSYHDASLVWDEGWTLTGRLMGDADLDQWAPTAEVRWRPLQNLGLSASAPLKAPWWGRVGVTAQW